LSVFEGNGSFSHWRIQYESGALKDKMRRWKISNAVGISPSTLSGLYWKYCSKATLHSRGARTFVKCGLPGGGVGFGAGIVGFGGDAVVYRHEQLLG
jgi:hypothetical protein